MKKLLFASLIALSFVGCKNDDDNTNTVSIVGKWFPVKDYEVNSNSTNSTYTYSGCETKTNIDFKENGTFTNTEYDDTSGSCIVDATDTGTYTYNSSTKEIKFTTNDGIVYTKVDNLTASEMTLVYEGDWDGDGKTDYAYAVFKK